MNEEITKDFKCGLITKCEIRIYAISLDDVEYEYTYTYDDGMFDDEQLTRLDGKAMTDEEFNEVMDYINNINDWSEYE